MGHRPLSIEGLYVVSALIGLTSVDVTSGGEIAIGGLSALAFGAGVWALYRFGRLLAPSVYESRPMRWAWLSIVFVMLLGGAGALVFGLVCAALGVEFRTT